MQITSKEGYNLAAETYNDFSIAVFKYALKPVNKTFPAAHFKLRLSEKKVIIFSFHIITDKLYAVKTQKMKGTRRVPFNCLFCHLCSGFFNAFNKDSAGFGNLFVLAGLCACGKA